MNSEVCRIGVDCPKPFYVSYDAVNGQRIISSEPIAGNLDGPPYNRIDSVRTDPDAGKLDQTPFLDSRALGWDDGPIPQHSENGYYRPFFDLPGWVGAVVFFVVLAMIVLVSR